MANEPTKKTTIVVDDGDAGVHVEGRWDDGFERVWDEDAGVWKSVDKIREYDADKDRYE